MDMDRVGIHSDLPRSDQHLSKCHPLQNAPLLLLNQARDIVRYGPLAPYMSLRKEKFNTDVPFFNIEACRVPEWSYNHLPSHQKTTFCSPPTLGVSDLHQNNQYCQPLAILHSTSLPLGRQEWVRRSVIPFAKEPVSTVSCRSDINLDSFRSNTGKTFSHANINRTDNSAHLALSQLQYNNEVCCLPHPTKYLEHAHPRTAGNSAAWMPIVTSSTVNSASSHLSLDKKSDKVNDVQGSFPNSLSTLHDKRSTKNYTHLSMEINRAEEPLNLIVNSNQNSNQVLPLSSSSPLSTSSSSSSLSPSVSSPLSLSMTSTHPLSVSSLSRSAYTLTSSLTSNSVHSHKNIKLDQQHSLLPSRGRSYIRCECCTPTTENHYNKQLQNNNYVKEKGYHASSNSNKITDSFLKDDNISEANQSPSCDRDFRSVTISTDTINTRHRDFQTASRNLEYINMLNHHSVSPVQENGGFSGLQLSNVRINEMQDNLRPSLGASAVEEGFVAERISSGLQRNPSTDTINETISSNVGWKDNQELSAFKNTTLLHIQRERDNSYAPQTELLSAKRNEKYLLRATEDANPAERLYNTCTISEADLALNNACGEILFDNQPLINSTKEFNSNRHNSIYPSRIRPVRILVGTSRNDGEVNPHISTTERSIWDESRLFISQSHPIQQPGRYLMSGHRKESQMHHSVLLPGIQEKGSNRLEEPRIKTAHCVSTIANPSEFSMNCELEGKKYYYDLNTRDVVPHSSYLPTNSYRVNPYISETDLSASDHEINTFSCLPVNAPYHLYEPRSLFTPTSSGEFAYNQNSQEKDRAPTHVQESQPHYTILRRSDSDGRQTYSTPITIVGCQGKDTILDSTVCGCPSNPTPSDDNSSVCNNRKHQQNFSNTEELVADNASWHDRNVNDNTISPQAHSMNCDDINADTDSYNVRNTMKLGISNNAKINSLNNNNGNRCLELSDSALALPLQNLDKGPLPSTEVTSRTDTKRSAPVDRSNEENLLMTNGSANDVIVSSDSFSGVTSIKTSDANGKSTAPIVLSDYLEITNDSLNVLPQCVYCEIIFSSTELLQEHLKTHMVSAPYRCSHCSLGFVSKARLLRHVQLHMNAKPYKCEECKNLFSTVTAFHRHLHSKKHSGKNLFECKECGISFINKAYVNLHYKTHTGEHPFQCEQCGNTFACKNNLKNHIMTHTGEKPYQCVHCAKRFVTNFSLKVHIRTHTKEYPYRCDICNKRFLCSSNMASHLRTHTGEKRHQCYKCGKFLSSWSGLQGHQRTHTKECPFSCDLCSKSFSSKFSLRIHHRIHSGENPHKCKYCDKCFSNSSNLQRHLRTHTGEKPYHCTYCGKTFCSSTYLKSHIRTHTGEKPHTCKFCGKGFSNTSCFKQHVKKHEEV